LIHNDNLPWKTNANVTTNLLQNVRLYFDNLTFMPNYNMEIPFIIYSLQVENDILILTINGTYKTTIK